MIEEIKQFLREEIKRQEENFGVDDHSITVERILDKVEEIERRQNGRIQPGSIWVCTDEDYWNFLGQKCKVIEANDHPDLNGDGEIEVEYENGEKLEMKVRRFMVRHERA